MQDPIEFKGIREGILVTIDPEIDWATVVSEMAARIDDQPNFFRGAGMALQLETRGVRRPELAVLVEILQERDIELISVLSTSAMTQGSTRKLGLKTELEAPSVAQSPSNERPPAYPETLLSGEVKGTEGILIRRTLRSGGIVKTVGHVVVVGDVNPGAEIIAGGDVIVWGRLSGVVHAGAMGDDTCMICALDLQPTQLRISDLISVAPPPKKRRKPQPECAFIENGQIRAESWKP